MFGAYITAAASMVAAIEAERSFHASIEAENNFYDSIQTLNPADRQRLIAERERLLREATEERRHREMVAAIRSTSFWRFGS